MHDRTNDEAQRSGPSPALCSELLQALSQLNRTRKHIVGDSPRVHFTSLITLYTVQELRRTRISGLAERLMIDLSAASRQVSVLENDGLLRRIRDESDHRACLVELTADGEQLLAEYQRDSGRAVAGRLTDWTDDQVERMTAELQRLTTSLCSDPAAGPGHGPGSRRSPDQHQEPPHQEQAQEPPAPTSTPVHHPELESVIA
ncbi:MarR family winged helix-turn-helix transcriptional regulator [Nakamurella alba]|uniref:MarR family winged helix-turn-helix transcriptional regulator n=1 Tax=Nakamurella alba TaxID=2665158 RepID=UPI0018AA5B3E|nr:MarR family winged helix-turn-helix transcriptional regulator [Nakamurella alba]